jgi:hypothetical protein
MSKPIINMSKSLTFCVGLGMIIGNQPDEYNL